MQDVGDACAATKLAEQWIELSVCTGALCAPMRRPMRQLNPHRLQQHRRIATGATQLKSSMSPAVALVVRLLGKRIEGFVDIRHSGEKFSFDNVYMRLRSRAALRVEQKVAVSVAAVDLTPLD